MKKIILIFFLLAACSFNSDTVYWNENSEIDYEEIKYHKDYTFKKYGEILEKYNVKTEIPSIN